MSINDKIIAKKSLGQNFILNKEFLTNLSSKINTNNEVDVIEVGPGSGALTDYLINKPYKNLFLIEKDTKLSELLIEKYKSKKNIHIFNEDALKFEISKISKNKEIIIVGNLPFNISSQLLLNWISYKKWPPFYKKMYLMFQKELGKRINAQINNKSYGKLSVLTQSRCIVKELIVAPANIFYPKPKVDGIVLEFTPFDEFIDIDLEKLKTVLKAAFKNRRKKIKNSLISYSLCFENWDDVKDLRPENLEVEQYCSIADKI